MYLQTNSVKLRNIAYIWHSRNNLLVVLKLGRRGLLLIDVVRERRRLPELDQELDNVHEHLHVFCMLSTLVVQHRTLYRKGRTEVVTEERGVDRGRRCRIARGDMLANPQDEYSFIASLGQSARTIDPLLSGCCDRP